MKRTITSLFVATAILCTSAVFAEHTDAEIDAAMNQAFRAGTMGSEVFESSKADAYATIKKVSKSPDDLAKIAAHVKKGWDNNVMPGQSVKLHEAGISIDDWKDLRKSTHTRDVLSDAIARRAEGKTVDQIKADYKEMAAPQQITMDQLKTLAAGKNVVNQTAATLFTAGTLTDQQIDEAFGKKFGYQVIDIDRKDMYAKIKDLVAKKNMTIDNVIDALQEGFSLNIQPVVLLMLKANSIDPKEWDALRKLSPNKSIFADVIKNVKAGKKVPELMEMYKKK